MELGFPALGSQFPRCAPITVDGLKYADTSEMLSRPPDVVLPCIEEVPGLEEVTLMHLPHQSSYFEDAASAMKRSEGLNHPGPKIGSIRHASQPSEKEPSLLGKRTRTPSKPPASRQSLDSV